MHCKPTCFSRKPDTRQSAGSTPSADDFWKIVQFTTGQDRIMLTAYLYLGARRSELFRLQWEDVDFENSRIQLSTRKRQGGTLEYDWLPMTSQLRKGLNWWRDNRTFAESPYVFVSKADGGFCQEQYGKPFKEHMHFMKTLCKRAGVKPFGFHAIRHLTASTLYEMGRPVSVIQAILRHKSPNTTALYLKSLGLEETRGALDSMADRFRTVSFKKQPSSTKVVFCAGTREKALIIKENMVIHPEVKLRRKQA